MYHQFKELGENVSVNKELEIQGAGQGITIVRPAISNPDGGELGSVIFKVQANNVKIHELTLDGKNDLITGVGDVDASTGIITDWSYGAGDWTNLEVSFVTVQDVSLRGIEASNNGANTNVFNIHDNTIDGVQSNAASIGIYIWEDAGAVGINTIMNCYIGIWTGASFGSNIFANNITNISGGTAIESDFNGEAGGSGVAY